MTKINGANNPYKFTMPPPAVTQKHDAKKRAEIKEELESVVYESGKSLAEARQKPGIYTKDSVQSAFLKAFSNNFADTLRDLTKRLTSSQAYAAKSEFSLSVEEWYSVQNDSELGSSMESYGFKLEFSFSFEYTSTSVKSGKNIKDIADALLSEDGPFGVKNISENILGFAKAISGEDASKIDMLRKAVQFGYDQVAAFFGGAEKMPEISQKTLEAVMKGFDDWMAAGKSDTEKDAE